MPSSSSSSDPRGHSPAPDGLECAGRPRAAGRTDIRTGRGWCGWHVAPADGAEGGTCLRPLWRPLPVAVTRRRARGKPPHGRSDADRTGPWGGDPAFSGSSPSGAAGPVQRGGISPCGPDGTPATDRAVDGGRCSQLHQRDGPCWPMRLSGCRVAGVSERALSLRVSPGRQDPGSRSSFPFGKRSGSGGRGAVARGERRVKSRKRA